MELREVIALAMKAEIGSQCCAQPMWGDVNSTDWHGVGGEINLELVAQAALDAIAEAGFVIVPREPTEAMLEAGGDALHDIQCTTGFEDEAGAAYRAMIAAATEPRSIPESTQAD